MTVWLIFINFIFSGILNVEELGTEATAEAIRMPGQMIDFNDSLSSQGAETTCTGCEEILAFTIFAHWFSFFDDTVVCS